MINISLSFSLPKREEGVPGRLVSNHFLFGPNPRLCIFPRMWEPYCYRYFFSFSPGDFNGSKRTKNYFSSQGRFPHPIRRHKVPLFPRGGRRGALLSTPASSWKTPTFQANFFPFPPLCLISPLFPHSWPMWAKGSCQKVKFSSPLLRNRLGAQKGGKKEKPRRPL